MTLLMLSLAAGIYWAYQDYLRFLDTPVNSEQWPLKVHVRKGTNFKALATDLFERKIITSSKYFTWYARSESLAQRIKAGRYAFDKGITPVGLLDKIVAGEVEQFVLTVIEGWTFRQMLTEIHGHPKIEKKLVGLSDKEMMQSLDLPDIHPEAWKSMHAYLDEQWQQRAEGLPLKSSYEALILASIVEKETGLASERPEIAGVFVRRLKKGMKLQTDPTVIYGMGEEFDGNIRRKDLRKDTEYNTYTRFGLPPTPIALPGKAAIHASLHPADGKSLYFVSKGDGSHEFSDTLEAHNRAVRRYQLRK